MTSAPEPLKPCPFCGSEARRIESPRGAQSAVTVGCLRSCSLAYWAIGGPGVNAAQEKKWNTRPLESALTASLAASEARVGVLEKERDDLVDLIYDAHGKMIYSTDLSREQEKAASVRAMRAQEKHDGD